MGDYSKVPVPSGLRGPAGEEAQILVDGIARRLSLFMGWNDWELDWHVYLDLTEEVNSQLRRVGRLHPDGGLFSELMVVNRWEDELVGRQWWSDDFDRALLLAPLPESQQQGGETISEDWSLIEDDNQGGSATTVAQRDDPLTRRNSALIEEGARVYLQGALVADGGHSGSSHLEIHPLDSIAYAFRRDGDGDWTLVSARPQESTWPRGGVRWRLAAFANSSFHRINDLDFVDKARTTVWYLDLPVDGLEAESTTLVTQTSPGFWNSGQNRRVDGSGVQDVEIDPAPTGSPVELSSFPVDPRDGRRKLRVHITMAQPDHRDDGWVSGRFMRDFEMSTAVSPDSGPAVIGNGPHVLDVFVRGRHDRELVHRHYSGNAWSGWINLGGDLASGPAVTADGPHTFDVFVRSRTGDDLVHRFQDGTGWSGWINLDGDLASAPTVTGRGPHVLDVFVRGRHGDDLVHRYYDGQSWSGWINLGGDLASGPAVTADGPHVLDVFVRGRHGDDLVHRYYDGQSWSGWINLGGDLASRPAVTARGPHVLDVFIRGKHNHELVHRFYDGRNWSGWINLGGDLASGPAVTADGPHVLDVFVRGKHNDELVHRYYDGNTWSGWINLGGDLA